MITWKGKSEFLSKHHVEVKAYRLAKDSKWWVRARGCVILKNLAGYSSAYFGDGARIHGDLEICEPKTLEGGQRHGKPCRKYANPKDCEICSDSEREEKFRRLVAF